ncbi:hypothetical protein ACJX0J_024856, partial [Zea mays]
MFLTCFFFQQEEKVVKIVVDAAKGLEYLHEKITFSTMPNRDLIESAAHISTRNVLPRIVKMLQVAENTGKGSHQQEFHAEAYH